jgi:hypothetical protein
MFLAEWRDCAEAVCMEFTISCPIDGPVEVGLEDIDTVVLREEEHADITFVCPHCGTGITVTAIVPAFLMAAIEALADDPEGSTSEGLVVLTGDDYRDSTVIEANDPRVDAYCEYFRRQLTHIECAEDAIAEIDSKATS